MASEASEHYKHYSVPARVMFWIGQLWLRSIFGKLSVIFFKSMLAFVTIDSRRLRTELRQIILQVYFTGIEAFPLIALVATLLGTLTITQALTVMPKVGFTDFFGNLMVIVIIRELGPVLTAFLIAGRTGAALAAYIGNMKVEHEVDALETMGIDPVKYIMMPSIIGGMVAMVILNALFSSIAIVVGFLVAKVLISVLQNFFEAQLLWDHYIDSILLGIRPMDFVMIILKPMIFGALIALNACLFGMEIKNDVREVPKATSKSVVFSFITVVIADLLLSLVYILEYMRAMRSML